MDEEKELILADLSIEDLKRPLIEFLDKYFRFEYDLYFLEALGQVKIKRWEDLALVIRFDLKRTKEEFSISMTGRHEGFIQYLDKFFGPESEKIE